MGPPVCDELVALVEHLFTEEEAGVVRHLGLFSGRTAAELARAEHRPLDQIEPILDRLSQQKRIIARSGGKKVSGTFCRNGPEGASHKQVPVPFFPPGGDYRYRLLPIVPGIFEMMLISHTPESLTDWHRRFIELFEALYETGYSLDYKDHPAPAVRYLPVGKTIDAHPMALPSDKLEVVFDQFEVFGIGQCQCRMAMQVIGQGCGKPLGNCTVMGQWAEQGIAEGVLRQVSKKEALEIKREAESHGMVNWMMNVRSTRGQCSCSCCGCCCHAMRGVNEFNAPGFIAPPHFLPRLDASKCTYCGKCAQGCPMGAIVVDTQQKTQRHLGERCIGCGLCVLACDRQHAAGDGAGARLQAPLSQLVLADCALRPRHVDDELEALAAATLSHPSCATACLQAVAHDCDLPEAFAIVPHAAGSAPRRDGRRGRRTSRQTGRGPSAARGRGRSACPSCRDPTISRSRSLRTRRG